MKKSADSEQKVSTDAELKHFCMVTAGEQVVITFRPGRLAPQDPLTHPSVQVSAECRAFLPPVKVTTTCSGSPSPRGRYRLSDGRRNLITLRPSSLDRLTDHQPDTTEQLGYYAIIHCTLFSGCVCPVFLGVNDVWRETHTNWKQRPACSPCCG